MTEPTLVAPPSEQSALPKFVKLGLVAAVIAGVLLAVRNPEVRAALSQDQIAAFIAGAGAWGPALFVLLYAVWVTLFLPAIVVTIAGSLIFAPLPATIFIVLGATLGACTSFMVSRTVGRDLVAGMLRGRIASWDDGIAKNGFFFVFYLRLLYAPFTYFNFAAGLTKVTFLHFFWGTCLGIIPGTFILVFFVDRLKELVAVAREAPSRFEGIAGAGQLLVSNPRYLIPFLIFVLSFFVPVLVKRAQSAFVARRESRRMA
ncbi:MAG: VTT domain-containing protein [Deltaproteobacteria bacterium]|nr:VTT domain-containing protein [Deltaproteobacteria bacterium]